MSLSNDLKTWNIKKWGHGKQNISTTDEGYLRVKYPRGSSSPGIKNAPVGGAGFYSSPSGFFPSNDVTLSYQVRFASNFDARLGGKMPGLFVSESDDFSGASGGRKHKKNASCRIMWRSNFKAEAYLYLPSSVKQSPAFREEPNSSYRDDYGDSLWTGILRFDPHNWNDVSIRVVVNTLGKADGLLSVTINGQQCIIDNLIWRKSDSVKVSAIFFSTFFGGKESYATKVDTSAEFRNFHVRTKVS